jgi:hypothetical protein
MRIRGAVGLGTYQLEVVVGGEDRTPVDRDTILVERVVDFAREQKQYREQDMGDDSAHGLGLCRLLASPQPLVGADATLRLKLVREDPSTRLAKASPCKVRLYDVRGRLLQSVTWNSPEENPNFEIQLRSAYGQSVGPGVYFIAVETGKQFLRKKIVILHDWTGR